MYLRNVYTKMFLTNIVRLWNYSFYPLAGLYLVALLFQATESAENCIKSSSGDVSYESYLNHEHRTAFVDC